MIEKEISLLEIVIYGHPVLTQKADEINNINEDIIKTAHNMVHTMHAASGIGLAAPQINRSIKLITVDLSVGKKAEDLIILVNPEISKLEGQSIMEEGCLSIPDINEKVMRAFRVIVKGIDLYGKHKTIEAEGLLARVFCHEIDHLNGKLFIDHLSALKKSLIKKKLRKRIERNSLQ